ncbi:MAG TPA: Hsp20/alpha crystallin family protein, partial [Chitinophagaceae bacterium]|nr:Hsp20/alpha crystallin family protein [Chitinophagaceae bacterium]
MTVVNLKTVPATKVFNNLMDNFFQPTPSIFNNRLEGGLKHPVAVNINEKENEYQLQIVAPGLQKEDFTINLEKNILTISAEVKNSEEQKDVKQLRSEYKFGSFKRSFTIDELIDADKISAEYVNGLLLLNLPKKEEVKPATKQITVL